MGIFGSIIDGGNGGLAASRLPAIIAPKVMVACGDSITQGGNATHASVGIAIGNFSGSGTTGTITCGANGQALAEMPVGNTFYLANFNETEWNGEKTVATNNGTTVTFINSIALTATPTLAASKAAIYFGSDISTNNRNFLKICNGLMGMPFGSIWNRAVSGMTSTQYLPYFADAIAKRPNFLWLMIGTNDVLSATSTTFETTIIANIKTMVQQALDAGATVLLSTIPPLTGAGGSGNPTPQGSLTVSQTQQMVLRLNRLIRQYAQSKIGVVLIDTHRVWASKTTNDWAQTGSVYTSDGTHPTSKAAFDLALEIKTILGLEYQRPFPLMESALDEYATDATSSNIIQNGLLIGTAGSPGTGITGNVATNYGLQRYAGVPTANCAVVANSVAGNNQQMTMTLSANNDQIEFTNFNSGILNKIQNFAGSYIQIKAYFKQASVPANTQRGPNATLEFVIGGVTFRQYLCGSTGGSVSGDSNAEICLYGEPIYVPSGTVTLAYFRNIVEFAGNATGAVYEFGRLSVEKLS